MINLPLRAIVSGVSPRITHNGVVFDYSFPTGMAGVYVPKLADVLFYDPAIIFNAGSPVTLDATGHGYLSSVNFGNFFSLSNLQPKTTGIRKYEIWGVTQDPRVDGGGINLLFNFLDGNNYFEWRPHVRASDTRVYIGRIVGGSFTFWGTAIDLTSVVGTPNTFQVCLYDTGDRVYHSIGGLETDTTTDIGVISTTLVETNRPLKNNTSCVLRDGSITVAPGNMRIRGFRISDV